MQTKVAVVGRSARNKYAKSAVKARTRVLRWPAPSTGAAAHKTRQLTLKSRQCQTTGGDDPADERPPDEYRAVTTLLK